MSRRRQLNKSYYKSPAAIVSNYCGRHSLKIMWLAIASTLWYILVAVAFFLIKSAGATGVAYSTIAGFPCETVALLLGLGVTIVLILRSDIGGN